MRAKTILGTLVFVSSISWFPSLGIAQPGGEDPAELDEENEDPEPEEQEEGGDPVVLTTGNVVLRTTDLRIAGRGMDFTFDRVYRSGSEVHSDLGRKWDYQKNVAWITYPLAEFHPHCLWWQRSLLRRWRPKSSDDFVPRTGNLSRVVL